MADRMDNGDRERRSDLHALRLAAIIALIALPTIGMALEAAHLWELNGAWVTLYGLIGTMAAVAFDLAGRR